MDLQIEYKHDGAYAFVTAILTKGGITVKHTERVKTDFSDVPDVAPHIVTPARQRAGIAKTKAKAVAAAEFALEALTTTTDSKEN